MMIASDDPRAIAAVDAIRAGDTARLTQLLVENPELATAGIRGKDDGEACGTRTLLHVVTDYPGHFPNGASTVAVLVAAGADVNARFKGPHSETPLHWAASSDDVAVLDALLDAGADVEATGAVIANGTPISDATAFGQWHAARRLIERGATRRDSGRPPRSASSIVSRPRSPAKRRHPPRTSPPPCGAPATVANSRRPSICWSGAPT